MFPVPMRSTRSRARNSSERSGPSTRGRSACGQPPSERDATAVLVVFVVGQILVLEYRWLSSRSCDALVLPAAIGSPALARRHARPRRDRRLRQGPDQHFALVRQQSSARPNRPSSPSGWRRQEEFRRESLSFQDRIGDIVQRLESHAGRMSTARRISPRSHRGESRAGASVQSTQRVSRHVDVVASSSATSRRP